MKSKFHLPNAYPKMIMIFKGREWKKGEGKFLSFLVLLEYLPFGSYKNKHRNQFEITLCFTPFFLVAVIDRNILTTCAFSSSLVWQHYKRIIIAPNGWKWWGVFLFSIHNTLMKLKIFISRLDIWKFHISGKLPETYI